MEYNITIRGQIGGWFGVSPLSVSDYLKKHKGEKVDVAICSPGGFLDDGLEIYQAFKDHGNVHAHIIGMTASAATIIAMGAKTVEMAKNSLMLIHNASTFISDWGSFNKEKLDQLLAKYKKQRDDLKTIDDLIANIYADRCGKSIEDICKKMTEGKWLSSQEAKDFGLVDSIREDDKEADKVLNDIRNQYSNSYITDFGLPALPAEATGGADGSAPQTVADAEGNPTEGFLQKTLQALKGLVSNKSASKKSNSMKKVFALVCGLLAIDALEFEDGTVNLKEDDVQKVEDRLAKLEKDAADADKAKDEVQKLLDEAKASLSEREKEIAALKGAPGDNADGTPETEAEAVDHEANRKLYNLINPD